MSTPNPFAQYAPRGDKDAEQSVEEKSDNPFAKYAPRKQQQTDRFGQPVSETDLQIPPLEKREKVAQGRVSSAGGAFMRGFGDIVASLPKAVGEGAVILANKFGDDPIWGNPKGLTPEDTASYQFGESIEKWFNKFAVNPDYQEEFTAQLASGAGSLAGFFAGGVAGRFAKIPALATTMGLGATATGVEGVEDYLHTLSKDQKADPEMRENAFALNALLGTSEGVPVALVFNRIDQMTGGGVKKIIASGLAGGMEELTQEVFQSVGQNAIANSVLEYDKNRGMFAGTVEAGEVGFTLGFAMNTLGAMIGGRRARIRAEQESEPGEETELPGVEDQAPIDAMDVLGDEMPEPEGADEVVEQRLDDVPPAEEFAEGDQDQTGVIPGVGGEELAAVETTEDAEAEISDINYFDNRLKRDIYRDRLRHLVDEELVSGKPPIVPDYNYVGGESDPRDDQGRPQAPMVRTPSLNPKWFQSLMADSNYSMDIPKIRNAVTKAVAGERLGVKQARVVGAILDHVTEERVDAAAFAREQLRVAREARVAAGMPEAADWLYEEDEYPEDFDGITRSFDELLDQAKDLDAGLAEQVEAMMESSRTDAEVLAEMTQLIGEYNGQKSQESIETLQAAQEQAAIPDPGAAPLAGEPAVPGGPPAAEPGRRPVEPAAAEQEPVIPPIAPERAPVPEKKAPGRKPKVDQGAEQEIVEFETGGTMRDDAINFFGEENIDFRKSDVSFQNIYLKDGRHYEFANRPQWEEGDVPARFQLKPEPQPTPKAPEVGKKPEGVTPAEKAFLTKDRRQKKAPGRKKERRTKGERRENIAERKRVSEMTDEEKDTALLTDELTGLKNQRAYEEDEQLKHQAFFDVDNFKQKNDEYTYDGADRILSVFGDIMSDESNDEVIPYRLHGDEFIVQSNSRDKLNTFAENVQKQFKSEPIEIALPGKEKKTATNLGTSYGIGRTKEEAESNMKKDKDIRRKAGLRTNRTDPASSLSGETISFEGIKGTGFSDAKEFSNFFKRKPFISKPFSDLNVDQKRMVMGGMIRSAHNLKIADRIISSIPVDMMDLFGGKKGATNMLLHDHSMFQDLISIDGKGYIPAIVDIADSLIRGEAVSATEVIPVSGDLAERGLEADSALGTIDDRHGVTPDSDVVTEAGEATTLPASSILAKKSPGKKIEATEFKKWFKKSKVVDDNNQPLIVYHGTNTDDIEALEGSVFLAEDRVMAENYGGIIMEVYASIQKPKYLEEDKFRSLSWKKSEVKKLKDRGHDGAMTETDGGDIYYVAFDSAQIKSVETIASKQAPELELTPQTEETAAAEEQAAAAKQEKAEVDKTVEGFELEGEVTPIEQSAAQAGLFEKPEKKAPGKKETKAAIDAAAHEAATSPKNDRPEPTEKQKENGKYKKGPIDSSVVPWLKGLKIMIENPAGTKRRPEWKAMKNHYGYFQGTEAFDGDEVDVFIGPDMATQPEQVHVVDQINPGTGKFDEHKVMLGFADESAAEKAYRSNYQDNWQGFDGIQTYPFEEFKTKLKSGFFKNSTPARKLKKAPGKKKELSSMWSHIQDWKDGMVVATATGGMAKGKYVVVRPKEIRGKPTWDMVGNYQDSIEKAITEAEKTLSYQEKSKAESDAIDAARVALADKLKAGTKPDMADFMKAFPQLEEWHTYILQPEISPFLIKYFGFSKARIKKPLGKAAGDLVSDMGSRRAIVHLRYLHEVLAEKKDETKEKFNKDANALEKHEFYRNDLTDLVKKHGDESLFQSYVKDGDTDRLTARIATEYFNELDPATQQWLEVEAGYTDLETGETGKGLLDGTVRGSHIYQMDVGIDNLRDTEIEQEAKAKPGKKEDHMIKSGEQLYSKTGRKMSLTPKVDATTDRKAANTIKRINAWLLHEARLEAANEPYLTTLLEGIDLKNISQSDQDTLNEVVFGRTEGPEAENRTAPKTEPAEKIVDVGTDKQIKAAISNAIAMSKADPQRDFEEIRTEALKAVKNWDSYDLDAVGEAIHAGRYEAIKEKAGALPVPVLESDIRPKGAFDGISHRPDSHERSWTRDYVQSMVNAWETVEDRITDENRDRVIEQFEKLRDGYASKLNAYFSAHGRVMSSFITGPANFPVRSNEKKSNTAQKRMEEASDWFNKGIKRLSTAVTGPVDRSPQSALVQAQNKLKEREETHAYMKAMNAAHKKYQKDPASLEKSDLSETDKQSIINYKPEYSWEPHPFAPYQLQNNNAEIRRLKKRVEELSIKTEKAEEGKTEYTFDGGRVEIDYADDRLRVYFDEKPDADMRQKLKSNGFRWSPKNTAWQRQITEAAKYKAESILGIDIGVRQETLPYGTAKIELTPVELKYFTDIFNTPANLKELMEYAPSAKLDGSTLSMDKVDVDGMNSFADRAVTWRGEGDKAPPRFVTNRFMKLLDEQIEKPVSEFSGVTEPGGDERQTDLFTDNPVHPAKKSKFTNATKKLQTGTFDITLDQINNSADAAEVMRPLALEAAENFVTLVLDKNNKPIALLRQFFGTIDGASVYPREVITLTHFIPGAKKVYFSHNHPSGVAEPSTADKRITDRLISGFAETGIYVAGHVIVGPKSMTEVNVTVFDELATDRPGVSEKPLSKVRTIPEYGRRVYSKFEEPGEALTSPAASREALKDKPAGLYLLNNRNQQLGYSPLTTDEVAQDKRGKSGWKAKLIKVIQQSNAAALIVKTADTSAQTDRLVNKIKDYAGLLDVRVLDAFDPEGLSSAERGVMEDPATSITSYSRKRKPPGLKQAKGVSVAAAQTVVDKFKKSFDNRIDVEFRVYPDKTAAFGEEYARSQKNNLIRGVYYAAKKGKKPIVALIASDLDSTTDALYTLRHEIIGHHGLNIFTPESKQAIIDAVAASRKSRSLKKLWAEADVDYAQFDEQKRAEEIIARIAQDKQGRLTKAWAAIVTAIRKALRAIGLIGDRVTRAEIQDLVNTMAEGLQAGKQQQTYQGAGEAQFARVFHGTPHKFDKFKTDRIGTGEGAQAYGYGLYFAESPGVAKSYTMAGLRDLDEFTVSDKAHELFNKYYPSGEAKIGQLVIMGPAQMMPFLKRQSLIKDADIPADLLAELKRSAKSKANLYEAEIPDQYVENFLDWDKPLSEQGALNQIDKELRAELDEILELYDQPDIEDLTGDELHSLLNRYAGESPLPRTTGDGSNTKAEVAEYLNSLGIKGIKYLDQQSRFQKDEWQVQGGERPQMFYSKKEAENHVKKYGGDITESKVTRNLVVFDESIIDIKSVDGEPMFSRTTGRKYTKEQLAAKEKGGFGKGAIERARVNPIKRALGEAKTMLDESKQVWKTILRQGFLDQYDSFRTIINDERAWMMANLSESTGGAIEAALEYGRPFMNQGAVDVDIGKNSLAETLEPLGEEVNDWLQWIAGNRAERLMTEDRERLFSDVDIKALKSLNQGTMADGRSRKKVYEDARIEFEKLNDAIVKIGVNTGIISKGNQKIWQEQGFYVPFYRLAETGEGENVRGPYSVSGLVKQTAYKRLKGADIPINDLLTNVIMNWSHVVSAGLKNQAAIEAMATSEEMGLAEQVEEKDKSKDAIFIRISGNKLWYELDQSKEGQLVLESLVSLNYNGLNNFMMKAARRFKRLLTYGVTASPEFKVANLIRDSVQAIAVADMSTNLAKNILQGFRATKKDSPTIARMIAGGGAFGDSGYIHGSDPEALERLIQKDVDRMTILDSPKRIQKMWDAYQDFGARLENVNRAANFEQDLSRGEVDLLTANFNARDHLDFQRTGAFVSIRMLAQVVPFLNARLQGLSKLGRSGFDPAQRKQFFSVVAVYALASTLLYLYMKDDEDYDEAAQWERDTYHLFKIPGSDVMYRIPRPFEVGFMATIVERATEQAVNDKVHGRLFFERLWHGLLETLSFNPMPQMVMPAVEVWANKNTFTGRQIESAGMKNLSPSERRRAWTSDTAIAMSKGFDAILWDEVTLSPVQIEHLVNGYFGWIGGITLESADSIARATGLAPSIPKRRIQDYTVVGRFARTGPTRGSRFLTEFYENLNDANRVYADIRFAQQLGNEEKAVDLAKKNKDVLALRQAYTRAQKAISNINKRILMIRVSKIPSDEKQKEMEKFAEMKNEIARRVVEKTQEK